MKEKKENKIEIKQEKYTKESILKSNKYSERKDILDVILENNKEYSLEEVEYKLNEFLKGEVS